MVFQVRRKNDPLRASECARSQLPNSILQHINVYIKTSRKITSTITTTSKTSIMSESSHTVEDLEQKILDLKKIAVAKKRQGDIESAKESLIQSKRLQLQLDQTRANECTANTPPQSPQDKEEDVESESHGVDDFESKSDGDLLDEFHDLDQNDDQPLSAGCPVFSLEEMIDLEMMTEFSTGGLPIPSFSDYQTKIEDCKKSALTFKQQGKTQDALNQLRFMKQLQTVQNSLEALLGSNSTLNLCEEESKEEKDLLQELFMGYKEGESSNVEHSSLDADDLLQMDLAEIKDALALGMKVPSIESMRRQVDQSKALALGLKQSGDLVGAKAALIKSKTLAQHATAIEILIAQTYTVAEDGKIESTSNAIQVKDLEELLDMDERQNLVATKTPPAMAKPRSSEELRQEAIRLRDEKKTIEATAVLKLYKEALAREAMEAELQQQKEMIQKLQNEVNVAKMQLNRFGFYLQLCDTAGGTQQMEAWRQYADICAKTAELVTKKGSKAVTIETGQTTGRLERLRWLPEDLTEIIENATDPLEERVEISVLDISELHANKVLQARLQNSTADWIHVDAHVSIQLPLTESETEKAVELIFRSTPIAVSTLLARGNNDYEIKGEKSGCNNPLENELYMDDHVDCRFDDRQYVTLARGDSKFAKNVLRRMERRKITITISCHSVMNPSKPNNAKKWFGLTKKTESQSDELLEPLNIGKVVLETRSLLDHNCIVGAFHLLGNGKRHAGGIVRLCIRTGVPFDGSRRREQQYDTGLDCLSVYSAAMKLAIAVSC